MILLNICSKKYLMIIWRKEKYVCADPKKGNKNHASFLDIEMFSE